MFRLTREVRFALNPRDADPFSKTVTNSYAGYPSYTPLAHYFTLQVTLAGDINPDSSYLLNIKDVDRRARELAIPLIHHAILHHNQPLNKDPLLTLFSVLDDFPPARLERLALHLTPFLSISAFAKELPMTRLSQKFEFSASHRLHNPLLPDDVNRKTFGKCNNPHGHGHNYELQVTLAGQPAADTGLLVDIPAFEQTVAEHVINRFDHKNLNVELPEFKDLIPSIENIARVIYRLLKPHLQTPTAKLASVTVWETPKTWCEYTED
jgi:6-pyruvoyltetrahydropterin/6-carboxytetrahydropterin synthase